ncbi:Scarecrow-like protein [Actinidia chinensis var. chinensis]|uniref:Scarecrow-like protein n=1 Tax=Actinidia chinensis var. chinensis TaxID=1590841 RepID=A0A2R6QSY1_ACTCC|nr:Scarecrow-like protein [Actinidia chinensis var. chinensis]
MVMDPNFSDSVNGFKFDDDDTFLPNFDQSENLANTFKFKDDSLDLNFMNFPSPPLDPDHGFVAPNSSRSSEVNSPDESDTSDDVLKYINSILMEENIEQKPSMFHDPLALQAAEKSLYDVLGEKYPSSPNQTPFYFTQNVEIPDYYIFGSYSVQSSYSNTSGSNSIDSQSVVDPGEQKPLVQSYPVGYPFESAFQTTPQWSFGSVKSFSDNVNGSVDSSMSTQLVSSIFSDSQSILQFNRGVEEASKFLPANNQLLINLESYALPPKSKEGASEVEKEERECSDNGSRGRKNHHREDYTLEEERSSKQAAVYEEEVELSEMFDQVLLFTNVKGGPDCYEVPDAQSEASKNLQQNGQPHASRGGKTRAKKQGNKEEVVDLTTLLINCAQSVAADDRRTANEQLKRIRQHSSLSGDGSQRLANIFADGLEARLAGTGSQIYAALASKRISATDKLKAYQLYLLACPFKKMSLFFTVSKILDLPVKSTKKKLHIIDFGIGYGFQWPILIKYLSALPGGTPELRITGIEFPQPGFRPAEFVEETGRRLAKYCERFKVPFQYHAIAQKWETIKIEDLNIRRDELIAVSCLFRFENLLDETVVDNNPRDAVLKLIRKTNPDIFIQSVINGSYSAPFFVTRFREALFHYSSLFDMFEANVPREHPQRTIFEKEFYGREVMNVIACEGLERVERPETYKQWQVRNTKAGFRILPLDIEILEKLKSKVKKAYHKDFVINEASQWMLQGWKGRVFCASSCWVPA